MMFVWFVLSGYAYANQSISAKYGHFIEKNNAGPAFLWDILRGGMEERCIVEGIYYNRYHREKAAHYLVYEVVHTLKE